jgi:hypothetical protein
VRSGVLNLFYGQTRLNHSKICDLPVEVAESSGIVIEKEDQIWTHNDAGYDNRLFLVDSNGMLLRTVVVTNAQNMDWEDLAYDEERNIWINDAGNNSNARRDLRIYKIVRSDIDHNDGVEAEIINFEFSDQVNFPPPIGNYNFDIEAMVWHSDLIYLFSKNRSNPTNGYCKMYTLPAIAGNTTAQLKDSFFVDGDLTRSRITAADFHVPTQTLALLSRTQIIIFRDFVDDNLFSGNYERWFFNERTEQVEGLAFLTEKSFYMTDEGSPINNVPGGWYRVEIDEASNIGPGHFFNFVMKWDVGSSVLSLSGEANKSYTLEIFSSSGQRVSLHQFMGNTELDFSYLPSAMYFFKISDGRNVFTERYFKK